MTSERKTKDLVLARDILESGVDKAVDKAWAICSEHLRTDPNDTQAMLIAGYIFEKAGNPVVAYQFYKRLMELEPRAASSYINLGRIAEDMWRTPEAERTYKKGLEYANRDDSRQMLYANLSALCIDNGRYTEAEKWVRKALEIKETGGALANLGFCQLANRNWAEGWKNYRATLGTDWRKRVIYKDEPEWDGSPDKTVVLYGEQGLGDEISFASMVPDALSHCKNLILDVDPRLKNLFARSFPQAKVYGTRHANSADGSKWDKEDCTFDASLAMGQIGEYFRTKPEDFTGEAYLIPDADRVEMWKALWKSKGKPAIGIAWTGGIKKTGAHYRKFELEQLRPLFDSIDAHWVNLEYKPSNTDGYPVHTYRYATLTKDYDDTAALVASLDLVICMQTAVAHLGGALGVPTWVFVPKLSQWRYGTQGDSIPWYRSLRVIRQTEWSKDIESAATQLRTLFGVEEAA